MRKLQFCNFILANERLGRTFVVRMTKDDTALADRAKRARRIVKNPSLYKVCFGCDSIVAAKVNICPNCHAYRFEIGEDFVVAQAKALSTREQNSVVAEDLM
ncbi:MAG: hypothetical protein AAF733_03840 [Verrucomicrobiota bacterium]